MSVEALSWALKQDVKTSNKKCLLLILANYADPETMECYPSIETLAKRSHMSMSSVKRCLTYLIENGFISKVGGRQGGPAKTNRYTVNLRETLTAQSEPLETPSNGSNGHPLTAQSLNHYPKGRNTKETATPSSGAGVGFKPEVKATVLPTDWQPPQDRFEKAVKAFAGDDRMDIAFETQQFISRAKTKRLTSYDWVESWVDYILRSDRNYKRWNKENKKPWAKLTDEEVIYFSPEELQEAIASGRYSLPYEQ